VYSPPSFREIDSARIREVIDADSFATLISPALAPATLPLVTHLPLQWDEGRNVLIGHLARANPHAAALIDGASALVVFHGAHGYISPTWYVDENPKVPNVPTWNYAVVHMTGRVTRVDDDAGKWQIVHALSAQYEQGRDPAWDARTDKEHQSKLGAIIGFEIAVETIDAKFKLSQNRSVADQQSVIAHLEGSQHPDAQAMVRWMQANVANSGK
jgi:transcriptional regulator